MHLLRSFFWHCPQLVIYPSCKVHPCPWSCRQPSPQSKHWGSRMQLKWRTSVWKCQSDQPTEISIQLSFVFCKAAQPSKERKRGRQKRDWMGEGQTHDRPHNQQIFCQESSLRSKKLFFRNSHSKNDFFINFIYACLSSNLAGCQDYGAGGSREKEKNEIWNIWPGTHLEAPGDHWEVFKHWIF